MLPQTEAADNVKFEANTENADGVETPPHKNAAEADPVETSLRTCCRANRQGF